MATSRDNEKEIIVTLKNEEFIKDIAKTLPRNIPDSMDADRFIINTISAILKNDRIKDCSVLSIKRCVTNAATMGLTPGTRECYLIPYGGECTMEIGPDGYKKIATRSGDIAKIYSRTIYKKDTFEYDPVNEEILIHTQPLENMTGEEIDIAGFYAVALYKDNMKRIKVLSKKQVDKLRKKSKASNSSAWVDSYESMGNTKAIKALCNELPKTIELATAIENDRDNELNPDLYVEGEKAPQSPKAQEALHSLHERLATKEPQKVEETSTVEIAEVFDGEMIETVAVEAETKKRTVNEDLSFND